MIYAWLEAMGRPWKQDKNLVGKMKDCECGCGEQILILDKHGNIPRRFKLGHGSRGINNYKWKGGRFVNTQGYVCVLKPEHPHAMCNGYVREHILVMEQHLGRYLTKDEQVHHINENKQDNRLENLQLMTKKEHDSLLKNMHDRFCFRCDSTKPYINGKGHQRWYGHPISGERWLCYSCYQKIRYHWKINNTIVE